ncbi:MAG: hypothetical protein U0791_22595 [Gemmataceae bacterium]
MAPVFGGCLTAYQPHRDHIAEHAVNKSEREVTREIHRKARDAWQSVRSEFPRKVFSAEFRDGFIDGYSDFLDRGGDGQPPAAPPLRYTQNKKYFTPEGHALMRDYLLGFQYGTEVAVATGQRQYLTVPVLIPDSIAPTHSIHEPLPSAGLSTGSDAPVKPIPPPPAPLPAPKPMTKLPSPRPLGKEPPPTAVSTPAASEPEGSKFGFPKSLVPPVPPSSSPTVPPLPGVPALPTVPSVPMPRSQAEPPATGVIQASGVKLPPPPGAVKDLPDDVPTPPVRLDDLADLPVIPVNHPEPTKK